jgi:anti-sigma B factor antagonist
VGDEGQEPLAMIERPSLQVREEGDITFLEFTPPDCVFSETAVKHLDRQLLEAVESSTGVKFIVDFANVQYVSSTVLGVLVRALLKVQSRGGELRITGIDKELKQLFRLTALHRVFYICDKIETAVDSFGKPKPAEDA